MPKLYYGSGSCTIEDTNMVVGLEIRYRGAIKITDKTEDNYHIVANNKKIIIFPLGNVEPLNDLFEYTGGFKIKSVIASDINGERVSLEVKKVFDYPELMESNPEDMTEITSENMNAGYQYRGRVSKTTVDKKIIKNQHSKGGLYLASGTEYRGAYHVHLGTSKAMTEGEHTEASKDLYIMVNEKLIKTGTKKTTTTRTTTQRTTPARRTSGGTSGGGGGGY